VPERVCRFKPDVEMVGFHKPYALRLNDRRERRGPAATELQARTGLNGWPPSAPR
jgi:hypothetical protein